jgi:hypothetical protein
MGLMDRPEWWDEKMVAVPWSVPLLQEVIRYAVKQYCYKLEKLHT